VAILVAVLAGAAVGLINGLLIAVVGVQPIVATLIMLVTGRAMANVYSNGQLTEIFDPALRTLGTRSTLGVPNTALIALVLAVLVGILVRRTTFGRRVVAIGGNTEASVLAGLPVKRTLITVYLMSGVLAAIAGVLYTARSGAANPGRIGELIELSAITAVVVGGTALTGGRVDLCRGGGDQSFDLGEHVAVIGVAGLLLLRRPAVHALQGGQRETGRVGETVAQDVPVAGLAPPPGRDVATGLELLQPRADADVPEHLDE